MPSDKIKLRYSSCPRCTETHHYSISAPPNDSKPIRLQCPNLPRRWRLVNWAIDVRANGMDNERLRAIHENAISSQFGDFDIDGKLQRAKHAATPGAWLSGEYLPLYRHARDSYIMGFYFPAMTAATTIVEKVLNETLLRLAPHFPESRSYQTIRKRAERARVVRGNQNWEKLVDAHRELGELPEEALRMVAELKALRNSAVHYDRGFDYEAGASQALRQCTSFVDAIFNIFQRKDILWVFDMPGEVWIRGDAEERAFVKEFAIPNCLQFTPESDLVRGVLDDSASRPGPLSDHEFIDRRKQYKGPDGIRQELPMNRREVRWGARRLYVEMV